MNPRDDHAYGDEQVERRLRDALMREADMVQPGDDGLERIHARLDAEGDGYDDGGYEAPTGRPGWRPWVAGLVAAAVVGVVVGLVYAGNREDPVDTAGTPTSSPSVTASPETPTESPSTPPAAGELAGVPVYWLGESKADVWLYREFRDVPDVGGEVASAVSAMTTLEPQDPDYSTPWSPASQVTVTQDGDAITVDLSADAFANGDVGSRVAERAIQQLVWTATAAAQSPGPVTITVDGGSYDAWGTVALGEPMTRDNDARGQIWIDSPTEGQTVPAGTVTVTGSSRAFEATIQWEVQDAGGAVVAEGFTMGGAQETYEGYEFTVDLTPGTYSVHLYADDISGGESPEGPRMFEQTRTITVQ